MLARCTLLFPGKYLFARSRPRSGDAVNIAFIVGEELDAVLGVIGAFLPVVESVVRKRHKLGRYFQVFRLILVRSRRESKGSLYISPPEISANLFYQPNQTAL